MSLLCRPLTAHVCRLETLYIECQGIGVRWRMECDENGCRVWTFHAKGQVAYGAVQSDVSRRKVGVLE